MPFMKKIAQIISALFHPILLPLYGIFCFFYASPFSLIPVPGSYRWIVIAGTFLYTLVLPVLIWWWMKKTGVVSDIHVRERKERTALYLATTILYFVWFYFLWRLARMSHMVVAGALGVMLINLFVLLINLSWKVSAHAAACGGVVGVVISLSYLLYMNPLLVLSVLLVFSLVVMLSRLVLHEHSPLQVIVGFYVGIVGVVLAYLFCYQFLFV